jgi:hypothetical protein
MLIFPTWKTWIYLSVILQTLYLGKLISPRLQYNTNTFSIITIFQTFWFIVSEIERVALGLPMTTLELTAISFSMMMFCTSVTWHYKPYVSRPRCIHTKNSQTVQAIRYYAQRHVS